MTGQQTASANYEKWRARHCESITRIGEPSREAADLADSLSLEDQELLYFCRSWDVEIEGAQRIRFEFYGLLDEDGVGLSDLGIWAKKSLLQRDNHYAECKRNFRAKDAEFYKPAYDTRHRAHAIYHDLMTMDPALHDDLVLMDENRGRLVLWPIRSIEALKSLQSRGLVTILEVRQTGKTPGVLTSLTQYGGQMAALVRLYQQMHVQCFAGSNPSKVQIEQDRQDCLSMEIACARLEQTLRQLEVAEEQRP